MDEAISFSSWMRFPLPRSALSLATVVVAYWAYGLLVVPVVEPQIQMVTHRSHDPSPGQPPANVGLNTAWQPLFAEDSWERQKPKILETRQFTLLFQDGKTQPNDGPDGTSTSLELSPCTVIFHPSEIPKQGKLTGSRIFIMQAPEGALLDFEGKLDLRRGKLGRLVGGVLSGPIQIGSPETEPGADDGVQMTTQNVSLTSDRIATTHQVDFRFGKSFGRGRGLNIQLQTNRQVKDTDQPFSAVSGLRSLELVHVDRVHLEVAGDAWPDPSRTLQDPSEASSPTQIEITCQGRFFFDFLDRSARFEENVDLLHLRPEGVSDQLNCELLELRLSEVNPIDLDGRTPPTSNSKKSQLPKLQPHMLIASGHPAIARSPAFDIEARAHRIVYDVLRRRIRLTDDQAVSVRYGRHVMDTPETEYELPAPDADNAIGRWWAAGPGTLRTLPGQDDIPNINATWQKEVRLRPQDEFHVLSLVGGSQVAVATIGQILADDIHCWLSFRPDDLQADGPRLLGPANSAGPRFGDPQRATSLVPERVMALRNVQIESPQLVGRTEHLEAWLTTPQGSGATVRPVGNPATKNRIHGPRRRLADGQDAPGRRLHVQGDKISLEIEKGNREPQVRGVAIDGNVRVAEIPSAIPTDRAPPSQPLSVLGNRLHIENASSPTAQINVSGTPSQIRFGELVLTGDHVQLQRQHNRLFIDGAGAMTVPLSRDLAGQPLEHSIDLGVSWMGQMDFDGAIIHFEQSVRVATPNRQIRADVMDVHLTERVDFQQIDLRRKAEVRSVEFAGQVQAENRSIEHGHVTSIDTINADRLTMDQPTGKLLATGPGSVRSVRYGRRGLVGFADPARHVAAEPEAEASLIFLNVEFQKTISGNMGDKQLHFEDNVRTVYGPIPDWNAELDPDSTEGLGREGILLTCQRLSLYDMGQSDDGERAVELYASGNTFVEGAEFTARAHTIVYTTAKDELIMSGGSHDAELWHRPVDNRGKSNYVPAREIRFSPRTRRVNIISAGTPSIQGFF